MPSLQPEYIGPRRPGHLIFSTDETGTAIVEGVRKLRYTPSAWIELDDSRLSGDALRLLLLIRRYCDQHETDGQIAENAVNGLAVEHGFGRRRYRTALDLLFATNTILRVLGAQGNMLRDAHFSQVCFTAHERDVRREQWSRAKRIQRGQVSRDDQA